MKLRILMAAFCLEVASSSWAAVETFDISRYGSGQKVPVSLAGFTGEVAGVLKFDLEIVGFEFTNPDQAQFEIIGHNSDHVEGAVIDRINKRQRLGRKYRGGSVRGQAHAFADEVVRELTGLPGIFRTKIVFKGQVGSRTEIYVADFDGANAVAVTADRALVAAPCWGPGYRMIFYTSYKSGYPDIFSQNLASGERSVVAHFSGLNTSPTVSPDGRFLAMILSKAGSPDLYVSNLDGSNLKRLTTTKEDESSPCWAPDSRTICVVSRTSGRPALYRVAAEGGPMQRIRTLGVASASEPSWSPDGKKIVFTAMRRQFEICLVDAQGGLSEDLVAGEDPSWSPNSRTIIFTRQNRNHQPMLSLLDVPTKTLKDVHLSLGSASQAAWAR